MNIMKILNKAVSDQKVYWKKNDDLALKKIRKKAMTKSRKIKDIKFYERILD